MAFSNELNPNCIDRYMYHRPHMTKFENSSKKYQWHDLYLTGMTDSNQHQPQNYRPLIWDTHIYNVSWLNMSVSAQPSLTHMYN